MKNLVFNSLLILIITFLTSCEKNKEKEVIKVANWDDITITTRNQRITISKDSDSANFVERIENENNDDKIKSKVFYLNQKERDSLHKYIYKMITKPVFTDKDATCYAGYVSIRLRDRNTTLCCEYRSVGEWSTVSPETQKIYQLLSKKVEIAYQ